MSESVGFGALTESTAATNSLEGTQSVLDATDTDLQDMAEDWPCEDDSQAHFGSASDHSESITPDDLARDRAALQAELNADAQSLDWSQDWPDGTPETLGDEYREFGLDSEPVEVTELTEPAHQPVSELRSRYPDDYLEPPESSVGRVEPFQHPREILDHVNPNYAEQEIGPYNYNCADCARSFENSWRGNKEVAAGFVGGAGEELGRTEEWAGEQFHTSSMSEVSAELRREGHGASAIVTMCAEREIPYGTGVLSENVGHAFNMVNHEGTVYLVDAQSHAIFTGSEITTTYPFDDEFFCHHKVQAMVFNKAGSALT